MTAPTTAARNHRWFEGVLFASLLVCGVVIVVSFCDAVGEFLLSQAVL